LEGGLHQIRQPFADQFVLIQCACAPGVRRRRFGLDEFAFHADPETLWGSASGRITWGFDLAIWSSHNGSDSLFYTFCREAAQGKGGWSHYRVTLTEAIEAGLVEKINQVRGMNLSREQFLKNCKNRSRLPEVFEQEYMCAPNGGTAGIVPWSAIERCMLDYEVERLHFEEHQIQEVFGEYRSEHQHARERQIESAHGAAFKKLFESKERHRLGFDVAASGRGNLTVIYVDQVEGDYGGRAKLAGLFTCRTQDWNFIKTALYVFMSKLNSVEGCGDETGLGRQICWEAAQRFGGYFMSINFASEKHNIGFTLMNQLAVGEKQFPRSERDVASDFFALRKHYTGSKWLFTESVNCLNAASHCDIAWAGGLASKANRRYADCGGLVG